MQKKLRIFIDHQIFTMQNFGGISRVFTELYKEFEKNPDVEPLLPILLSDNEYLVEIKKVWSIFPKNKSFLKKLFYYAVNRIYSTFVLIKGDFDIFQPTYYDPYFLPFLRKKPFFLVLHDMTHEIFPDTVSKKDMTIQWKRILVNKAERVITISENTKKDILKYYDIDKEKIDIVSWGTSIKVPKGKLDIELPKKYILFIGNRKTYKNFEFFVKSISPLLKGKESPFLVCAGSSGFNEYELSIFKELGIDEKVKHLKFKDDEQWGYIFNNATCFVFPSLYEGFGIPVLEAFACGCPTVLSNSSSLPEVGGDAAVYFDPEDSDSIYSAVKKVIEDSKLREDMIRKGKERFKLYSWKIASDNFIYIYRKNERIC